MNFFRPAKASAAQIERDASLWAIRCERGLTAAEQDEFLQWLATDQRHAREFARHRDNWSRLGLLADWRPEHSPRPNRDLLAPPPTSSLGWRGAGRFWIVPAALAAAAAIVVTVFQLRTEPVVSSAPVASAPISPIEQRALPDGTTITLNRGAEISVRYTTSERRVVLGRGEAHFDVARIPGRPFVVSVHDIDVRAVGTAFNVRLDPAAVEVLVTEGRVEVNPAEPLAPVAPGVAGLAPSAGATIEAGQRSVISLGPVVSPLEIVAVTAEQIAERLAWQPTFLDFTDAPLASIAAEFNRRNAPVQIVIPDVSLAKTEVSASLRSDNIEGFLRLLDAGFGVEAERSGNVIGLRRAKKPKSPRVP
jgi:transmembrane sensor